MKRWRLKLLYDGQCPLCRREVAFIKRRDRAGRIATEDITAADFDAGRYGLTFERVYGRMHAVLPDGRVIEGMEVFRRVYAELGWDWLIRPTGWPVLRPIFDGLYFLFAKVRPYLSGHRGMECGADRCSPAGRAGRDDRADSDDRAA